MDNFEIEPEIRDENHMMDDLMNEVDMDIEEIHVPMEVNQRNSELKEKMKNRISYTMIEKDMARFAPYRSRFITDHDIWAQLYHDNILFKYNLVYTENEEGQLAVTTSSYFKASTMFFLNKGMTKLKVGMITGTKNMSSISCGLLQLNHNVTRRLQFTIGGAVGSLESINVGMQIKPKNTTSIRYRANYLMSSPNQRYLEHTFGIQEQLTEDFSMGIEFITSKHDELKLSAKHNLNFLNNENNKTCLEFESRVKNAILTGTLRLKNQISESYATQLEVTSGSSGAIPMLTLNAELVYTKILSSKNVSIALILS